MKHIKIYLHECKFKIRIRTYTYFSRRTFYMNHSMGFIIWKRELSWVPSKHCILDFGIKDTGGILGPEEWRCDYKDPKQQTEDDCWFLSNFHCFFFKYYNWFVLPEKINNNLILVHYIEKITWGPTWFYFKFYILLNNECKHKYSEKKNVSNCIIFNVWDAWHLLTKWHHKFFISWFKVNINWNLF